MMNRIMIAATLVVMGGGAAFADVSTTFTVNASGYVQTTCSNSDAVPTTTANIALGNLAGANGRLGENIDSARTRLGTVNCNGPAKISFKSEKGGLQNGSTACTGELTPTCVLYSVLLEWNGISETLESAAAKNIKQLTSLSASGGNVDLHVTIKPLTDNNPTPVVLAPGEFKDTLTIEVGQPL